MPVNPPVEANFIEVEVANDNVQGTVEHPDAVYLPDVQAVELEIYRATVEGRSPDFSGIPENAVKAAGYVEPEKPVAKKAAAKKAASDA